MSKTSRNGERLGNSKRIFNNRSKRRKVKNIIREGRFEELEIEEEIEPIKEPEFKKTRDR